MKRLLSGLLVLLVTGAFLLSSCQSTPTSTTNSLQSTQPAVTTTAVSTAVSTTASSVSTTSPASVSSPAPSSTPAPSTPAAPAKLDVVRLIGTIGPMSIPLAYLVENNSLASVAEKTTLEIWSTPAQLQAIITGSQGDFLSLPSNSAATFYNKGIKLQYLDNSIWNILYIVTSDPAVQSMEDLRGKTVVVPYQNAVPDAMFQSLCQQYALDLNSDIEISYTPDPIQASQLLLTGEARYVLLSEPSATSVIMKGSSSGQTFYRAVNIGTAWHNSLDGTSVTPVAGTVVMGDIVDHPDIVKVFMAEYAKAIDWMLANPEQAGEVGARALEQQGFTAPVLTASLNNIDWRYVKAVDARAELEDFYNTLSLVSPNFIGGKLPDNGFYYNP